MKIKKLISLLLVAVLVLPVLSACGGAADDTVVIGYIGDLSGNDAYVGIPPQLFLQDYFDEINENGGIYAGMDRYEARKAIVKKLDEMGLLVKVTD